MREDALSQREGHAMLTFMLAAAVLAADDAKISVQVLSATTKDKVVPGAQVIFQKEGQTSQTATSDDKGTAASKGFGIDDPTVSLIIKKDGFSPLVVKCPCNGMTYAISETLKGQIDAFRVVLNWGEYPLDLDLHGIFGDDHVFFQQKNGHDAFLDVDDTNGYGPETLTIKKRHEGTKYVFAINNYSADGKIQTNGLSHDSNAKVMVYVGESLIRSYYVPQDRIGSLWVLFAVDEQGVFHDINQIVDVENYQKVVYYMQQLTRRTDFGVAMRTSTTDTETAKELATKAEEALKAGNSEKAIELYQASVERNPNYGEGWNGLANAYDKLKRTAEATWAKKKAAEANKPPPYGYRVPNDKITLEASTTLKDWKQYNFKAANLIDDNLWTSWQPTTKKSGGVNDWVKLTFGAPQTLSAFEFSNGFRRIDDLGDLYIMNNRIKGAKLEFSDGTSMNIELPDNPTEVTIPLKEPKKCDWVKMTVTSIYKGTKWNDLAVSEMHPLAKE
jgi:tetratricopeptide (TPR) repeat protein